MGTDTQGFHTLGICLRSLPLRVPCRVSCRLLWPPATIRGQRGLGPGRDGPAGAGAGKVVSGLAYDGGMSATTRRVLLAKPRGYCAGVDRAVQTVEMALERYGAPVYVRKQIVHNLHVVRTLEKRGAIFVDETDEIPPGSVVGFSAHGIAPSVREEAPARDLQVIDATCPLVTKGP